jgi:SNF2 family DNA or RNA helicase
MENFIKVYENKLIEDISDINDPMLLIYDNFSLCIIDSKDYKRNLPVRLINRNPNITQINIQIINKDLLCRDYSAYNNKKIIYPFVDLKELDQQLLTDHNFSNLNRFVKYPNEMVIIMKLNKKLLDNTDVYFIDYYVNKNIISNILKGKKEVNERYIINLFENIQEKKLTNECDTELNVILNNTANDSNDLIDSNVYQSLLKENTITLYNYQLNDINWLNSIKRNIDSKSNIIEYNSKQYVDFDFGKDIIDLEKHKCIYYQNRLIPGISGSENTQTLEYRGGYLINSMGLGKTVTMLCFLLEKENTLFNQFVKDTIRLNCNYFYKRGAKAGKHCDNIINTKKSELFCTEHSKTPFIDKKVIEFDNLQYFEINDFKYNYCFKTNANLIICPTHLCDQWAKEYYANFKSNRRILLVVTYDQFNNLTMGDILFADIIIISYNFLLNARYQKHKKDYRKDNIELDTLKKKENFLSSKKFNFDMFYFNTKIMDEVHEIMKMPNSSKIEAEIMHINSEYTWNISGTPFANGIMGFLNGLKYITNIDLPNLRHLNLYQFLSCNINKELVKSCNVLFRRNTKESIKNEFSGNIINNTLNKLIFTDPERNIYDGYNKGHPDKNHNFLIKLCCDPEINVETQKLIQNCKTLDEIQKVLLSFNKGKLDKSNQRINDIRGDIEYIQNQLLELEHDSEEAIDYRIELGNYRRSLTTETKNYNDIKRVYDYLKNVVDNLKVSETCPICLDDTIEENLAITKCGHKFCWDCINEYIEETTKTSQTKCPKCNIQISTNDIYLLKESKIEIKLEQNDLNEELSDLVAKIKSTKLGNIIYYLKNELADNNKKASKIIIFSQWDQLLDKLKNLLDKYKIKTSCVKGSVYQRKNAIETFSNFKSDTNIILLSSKNAASGINLTAANKIILVEPVYGTIEYRKDIENQSIGRCARLSQKRPIEVLRFIIKDTIEEEIYNSGYTSIDTSQEVENLNDTLNVLEL